MSERIRGRRAVELRKARLAREPLCRMCKAKGVTQASSVPDHIIPLAKGGTEDASNIRCLCSECHRDATANQFGFRRKPRISVDGWPLED